MIPLRTGNLSVAALRAAWHGVPPPDPGPEVDALAGWRAQGLDEVEDYLAWATVEPRPGAWDFSRHRVLAEAARGAGLGYWVFLWLHVSPPWFRAPGFRWDGVDGPAFVPMRCLEHGCSSPFPSLHAAGTRHALERFYRAVGAQLGALVDGVVVGFPADYGEVGYPSGVADWVLAPDGDAAPGHHHDGWWCDEAPAAAAFGAAMRAAHGAPAALAARWGLDLEAAARTPYPRLDGGALHPRHRDDFLGFYRGAVSAWTDGALELAAACFPGRPLEIKLGHCSEAAPLGRDLGALVAVARARGAGVRSTQSGMEELFTARLASLCRTAGVPFATEAPREIAPADLARRVFADVAQGCAAYFEYPEQHAASAPQMAAIAGAWGRARQLSPLAVLYPTRCLDEQPGLGVWDGLAASWPALARVAPLETFDEAQIAAGALEGRAALLLLASVGAGGDGGTLPAGVQAWLRAGGVLIRAGGREPAWSARSSAAAETARTSAAEAAGVEGPPRTVPRYRLGAPLPACLRPGLPSAAPWLGPGWLGREDGAFAWPGSGGPEPVRWTDGDARLLLPRPGPGGVRLSWSLYVPDGSAPARLELLDAHGRVLSAVRAAGPGVQLVEQALPHCGDDDVLRLRVVSGTHRSAHACDRRALGVLVREVREVRAEGLGVPAPPSGEDAGEDAEEVALQAAWRVRLAAPAPWRAEGRGAVLAGDGSNLFVLAALRAWLAGTLDSPPPPSVARDAGEGCEVAVLDGGLLLHAPGPRRGCRPRLVGAGAPGELPPLAPQQTRWLPAAPA